MKTAIFAIALAPSVALASPMTDDVINAHILPRYVALAETADALAVAATQTCDVTDETLRGAYSDAFDAWIGVSHLRFGPSEAENRAFALAYWPDTRGVTPRSLTQLITSEDAAGRDPALFPDVSIASRGYYALEFLMYDDAISALGDGAYRCDLLQTITADIATTTTAINDGWGTYADLMLRPSQDGVYRDDLDVTQELYKALTTGLEFSANTRLGRPLGTFDKPRPTRAEARRSGRSARHVEIAITTLRDLSSRLAMDHPNTHAVLDGDYARAIERLAELNDPTFAGVADPMIRFRIEALSQLITQIDTQTAGLLGPALGVSAGFNALDGD